MRENEDPLVQVFGLLKSRSREREAPQSDLEERMMKALVERKSKATARRRTAFALVVCLAVGGTAFAAGGGVEKLKQWFGMVELVSPDGQSQTYSLEGDVLSDSHGRQVGELTITPAE
jgi:hypothetical protein